MKHPRKVWCAGISSGATTLVEGAAGTGKTSALDEAAALWERRGHRVIRAHGSELDRALPFGIVAQLFEPVLDEGVDIPPDALGALRLTTPSPDFAVLHAVYRLAVRLAGDQGLLVVVDDVHWADAPSLRWLAYLALRVRRQPISLLLSIGSDERCDDPSFAELVTQCERVVLGDLDLSGASELAARVYGGAVDPEFVSACLAASEGNPQLAGRLLRAMSDDGVPPRAAAAWRVAEYGTFVRGEVVLGRLRRRPPAVVTAAQCVAVLGADPHSGVLAELAGLPAASLADALRTLESIGALGSAGSGDTPLAGSALAPGVRAAVLDDMPPAARSSLHLRAARSLRNHGVPDRLVAEQLLETPPGADPWAGEVLDRAARDAVSRGESDAAARLLWRSLREPNANPARAFRLLGIAELVAGQPGATARLREAFTSSDDPRERARTAIPLALALHDEAPDELTSVLDEALSRIDGPLAQRLREHRLIHAFSWATAVPDSFVAEDAAVNVLYRAAACALDATTSADLTAAALENHSGPLSLFAAATTLSLADRSDDAITLMDKVLQNEHAPVLRGLAFVFRANAHRRKGDLTAAKADARAAEPLLAAEVRWPTVTAMFVTLQVDLLMEDNRVDEADALLDSAGGEAVRDSWSWAGLLAARGRVNIVRGDARAALENFLAAREHASRWPFRNPALLPWRAGAALACAALGDHEQARRYAEEELECVREWGAPRSLGMTLRAAGRVSSGAAGRALLESAVVVLRSSTARLELARALTDLGVVLRRHGDTSGARTHLKDALDLAQKCGSAALSARAYAELVATGSGPRRLRQTGPTALTPTEHQVASLAARGRSNEEIATTLLVPAHTVDGLLSGACRKLGVSGRLQLTEVLDVD